MPALHQLGRGEAGVNADKIKKLLELSKNLAGGDVWPDMLEHADAQEVLKQHPFFSKEKPDGPPLYPAADVLIQMDELIVLVDLPGVRKEDVQLCVDGDQVLIQGTARQPFPQGSAYLRERFQGEFQRAIRLPRRVDADAGKIRASFGEGLLTIRIPGQTAERRPIRIE
ncbi:hypothetical protein J31TS4_34720 [Paenibacillus sp. J31TS4]|nr:hypothetical protein J31TS4_34720 [Paenibacillus sp. J31TS4]